MCYRPDFRKRGNKVLWEHIIFVSFYILQFKDECLLSNIWFGDDYLESVISSAPTNISTLFKEPEVQKRILPECQRILESDNRYSNEQPVILRNKQKGLTNCRRCKSTINVGKLRLKTEYLVVPFNKQNAIVEALFCCPKKQCAMHMTRWIHLKPIAQIVINADFEAIEKEKVLKDFDLN